MRLRSLLLALLVLAVAAGLRAPATHAQEASRPLDAPREAAFARERSVIETTLHTVIEVLREATLQRSGDALGQRLRGLATELSAGTAFLTPAAPLVPAAPLAPAAPDLDRLAALLADVRAELEALREALPDAEAALAAPLERAHTALSEAQSLVRTLQAEGAEPARRDGWLRPGRYDAGRAETPPRDGAWLRPGHYDPDAPAADDDADRHEADRHADDDRHGADDRHDHGWTHPRFGWYGGAATFAGDFAPGWPFRETAVYRPIPAVRYNRVEGLVLGFGLRPLAWGDAARSKLYGQLAYAFALDKVRYEIGAETRLDRRLRSDFGLKVGGAYRRNTTTEDLWKSSWVENSLAAFFFEHDFFDYYETEGWTLYAVQQLTPYLQLSGGYRAETHRALVPATTWSLFGGDGFYPNLPADPGSVRSVVLAAEGGRVRGLYHVPRGAAFRAEAELGSGLGGDFAFRRYTADARLYLPVARYSSLSLRLRAGLTEGDVVPLQKGFTVGGIGTVRAYPQNAFYGSRALVANAEYTVADAVLFDDVGRFQLFGFADAAWTNGWAGTNTFRTDDILPAAGVGLGFDDRTLRLELAWPLRDAGYGLKPTLWLRLSPTF